MSRRAGWDVDTAPLFAEVGRAKRADVGRQGAGIGESLGELGRAAARVNPAREPAPANLEAAGLEPNESVCEGLLSVGEGHERARKKTPLARSLITGFENECRGSDEPGGFGRAGRGNAPEGAARQRRARFCGKSRRGRQKRKRQSRGAGRDLLQTKSGIEPVRRRSGSRRISPSVRKPSETQAFESFEKLDPNRPGCGTRARIQGFRGDRFPEEIANRLPEPSLRGREESVHVLS